MLTACSDQQIDWAVETMGSSAYFGSEGAHALWCALSDMEMR